MIDAVLTCYGTPDLSGVAKFNAILAKRLGVPSVRLGSREATFCHQPLISLKPSEVPSDPCWELRYPGGFSLFLHAWTGSEKEMRWVHQARQVYAANGSLAELIRTHRADVVTAWCPSTLQGNPTRGAINVLTFGMAHKLQMAHYRTLHTLLEATRLDYTVSLSTAVHEGSPWEQVSQAGDTLRTVFGDRLRCLGYLLDDALAKELQDCSAVALFFDPALRANNTSFWAARAAGVPIIFNADEASPCRSDLEIDRLQAWPNPLGGWTGATGARYGQALSCTWEALTRLMGVSA